MAIAMPNSSKPHGLLRGRFQPTKQRLTDVETLELEGEES
jgi:hypothetical protein